MSDDSKELPKLEPFNKNLGYVLGRLVMFAEFLQKASLGREVTSSLRRRFIRIMSLHPRAGLRDLMLRIEVHLDKFRRRGRKEKKDFCTSVWWGRTFNQIREQLPTQLPEQLSMDESATFMIGLFHQERFFYTPYEQRLVWEKKYGLRPEKEEEEE